LEQKNMTPFARYACVLLATCFCIVAPLSAQQNSQTQVVRYDPSAVLRSAQTIFIRTKSVYFKASALEQELLSRDEFQQWGFAISRDEKDADLIIEVERKLFTNRFVYSVLDPRTERVLMGGKIGSLGGSIESQMADGFVKRLKRVRPLVSLTQVK